ncbi:hypothetical protein JJB09_16810 [Rhizobium sp. KVB221]|uniref:Fenitrothion hydrolase n=1 Tax=Rhizobium setariae TaxID=2801340 RepID=A0A937CQZ7_9HYPH|nr:hypothetical protein [Rhizobium setariae]MBL0373687.1 hypothetical protein [Rhizobium setariae]
MKPSGFFRAAVALSISFIPGSASAHGSEASIVLLLPTGYYLAGAALAVAASFLLLAFMPVHLSDKIAAARLPLGSVPNLAPWISSSLAFLFLTTLVASGLLGTRDPVGNPLPTMIWTIWWVCFTVLQSITGPLWPHLNPWTGPRFILRKLSGRPAGEGAALPLRPSIGYLIAIAQFSMFAWFELIDLAPSDPERLAMAVSGYWLVNLLGAMLCGEPFWMRYAEPFSIFFGLIGRLSPFDRKPIEGDRTQIALAWPGRGLIDTAGLPLIAVLFILLTLSTVAFDGFSRTFLWLSAIDINPLEFPGRSVVVTSGTLGLIGMFVAQSTLYLGSVALGCALAGSTGHWKAAAGRLIYSIVPISLAFQAAHYLTTVLIDGQNALIAISDPFSLGWNLFGTADDHTTTSFLNTLDGVTRIFNAETAIITAGHVVGIVMAHLIALRIFKTPKAAVLSQIPLAVMMVSYTAFGLWLLATPRI